MSQEGFNAIVATLSDLTILTFNNIAVNLYISPNNKCVMSYLDMLYTLNALHFFKIISALLHISDEEPFRS